MVSSAIGLEVPVGLAALESFTQLGCPADLCLLFVVLETAVFRLDVQHADYVMLVVSDKPDPVPQFVLVQPALGDWL